jgi:mercuric ion transport protein
MNRRTLLRTGAIGSAVTAVCCFTPILVLLLTGLGLSAAIGWLDWVLLPALALFLAMTAYALWLWLGRRRQ